MFSVIVIIFPSLPNKTKDILYDSVIIGDYSFIFSVKEVH